jgi:hypothetical protein
MFETPILYLIFNRPDLTEITFSSICKIKPKKLFIAADGPRSDNINDEINCKFVRDFVLSKIDWDCEVNTLFRDKNLGCGKAVSSAISWFFSNVEAGIILEDDCLPDKTFFKFCEELLEYYKKDDDIMTISGSNLLGHEWKFNTESYFWGFGGIWGWATWRRAWMKYDFNMINLNQDSVQVNLRKSLCTLGWYKYYNEMFNDTQEGKIDTWDVQWFFCILYNKGLSINPNVNLIKNIGFGINATHTTDIFNPIFKLKTHEIKFPLNHPHHKNIDLKYIKKIFKLINPKLSFKFKIIQKIKKLINNS